MDLNQVTITGYISGDYNVKNFDKAEGQNGYKVLNGNLVINEPNHKTNINFTAWDNKAKILEDNTLKGTRVLLEGAWRVRVNEKDGKKYYNNYLDVQKIILLETKNETDKKRQQNMNANFTNNDAFDDDLPF
ncbi:single-stranded DNA-binding protein [Staphylococcus gallinarum]|uniref:single-stranded DNA-binding protein n=1 Tax=Staphylococcus gallinarum TaxID=1293 RepID=UPI001E2AC4D8|nr:single-stranded DNA-binding protein [Staphylococcus gallinarum]MCD8845212.1 single-stranded DNA-binding protein [Staphylococcus gallinarum]